MQTRRLEIRSADVRSAVFTRGDLHLKLFELVSKILQNNLDFTLTGNAGDGSILIEITTDQPVRAALGMAGAREGDADH